MDSRTGKRIRLGRLFDEDSGRSIIVAYSHGVLVGPPPGGRTIDEMMATIHALRQAEGIMIAPGLVEQLESGFVGRQRPSLVIHQDWQNFSRDILPVAPGGGTAASLAAIEEIAAAGADGLMSYLYVGQSDPVLERDEIERNARLARDCERVGIALMIEPRSAREREDPSQKTDQTILAMYCRLAAEIGASIVKCIWPGSADAFGVIAETCPAPLLVAGGTRKDDPREALQQAAEAVRVGAAGLVYGRNVYQAPDPALMLEALRAIVHKGSSVDEAFSIVTAGVQ